MAAFRIADRRPRARGPGGGLAPGEARESAGTLGARRRILVARAEPGRERGRLDGKARCARQRLPVHGRRALRMVRRLHLLRDAANHSEYVNAAAAGRSPILRAEPPQIYPPKPGDLICRGRYRAADLTFRDLPTTYLWPGHCGIVVSVAPGTLDIVGGNVEDAVRLTHVPITERGTLGNPGEPVLDQRYRWFVVLQVLYDGEAEPTHDE